MNRGTGVKAQHHSSRQPRAHVRAKVKSGAYASNSEVTREALRVWQERGVGRAQRLVKIRREIEQAVNDTRPSILGDEVFGRLRDSNKKALRTRRHGA